MKAKTEPEKQMDALIKKLARQTKDNDHTGAMITLAKFYGLTRYIKIFTGIKSITDGEGHKPMAIYDYNHTVYVELVAHIAKNHPADWPAIYNSL